MKSILITLLAAGALVACSEADRTIEQSKDAAQEQLNAQKDAVDDAAERARERIDARNEAERARITAQEEARKAQIEADKEKVEAQAEAQKQVADAQEDLAQGAPGAVQSRTATEQQVAGVERQVIEGRITSVNSPAGTLTVTDANGRQEFKLENNAMLSQLKNGQSVTVHFHDQNGVKIVDSVDLTGEQQPPEPVR
ncbi:MAG: hypothetical protein AB9869_34985 [Verrucomicrobiia bacterium]